MIEDLKLKHPNLTEKQIGRPNTFDTASPERRELKRIVAAINLLGGVASITNASAKRVDNRKGYVDGVGFYRVIGSVEFVKNTDFRPGTSDITATWRGRSWSIELKRIYATGHDKQSQAQALYQRDVERAGGLYVIVTSFDDFYAKYIKQ